ncbi:ORF6N domain-containing protein [Dethiosulfatarculus sandiegensis]|uniref:KilA-N DNA-binding domain-containing protein n=1 Tax=Dethiosulfatarculus sandiegensis TaxID=1429043 RepID=A0A0D2JPB9_9BACT|nr:ORF6N domain-containing protein [Dethiosulfatarculus sandiegensis]KIX11335.1 hypothetical protein X474_23815 [Dethiosulfatarculus sandiegensis]
MAEKLITKTNEPARLIPHIKSRIFELRGVRVILSADLAELYGVSTKALNQQVSRNPEKFKDISFKLSKQEFKALRSQIVTSKGRGGTTHPPNAFTVRGAIMAATVLRSEKAVKMSQLIVDVFVDFASQVKASPRPPALPAVAGQSEPGHKALTDAVSGGGLKNHLNDLVDSILTKDDRQMVARETRETARRALAGLQEYLDKPGLANEKSRTEIARMIAEIRNIQSLGNKAQAEAEAIDLNTRLTELVVRLAAELGDTRELMQVVMQLLNANTTEK